MQTRDSHVQDPAHPVGSDWLNPEIMANQEINNGASAIYRALKNPLILELILKWISRDEGWWPDPERLRNLREENPHYSEDDHQHYFGAKGVLVRCAQVSRQWHYEAARVLWREWKQFEFWHYPFVTMFEKIEPARRQFYAELIHHVEVYAVEREELHQSVTGVFDGLCFSNLESLTLLVAGEPTPRDDRVEIPIFHAPRLITLSFDPYYGYDPETYGVGQDEWKQLFDIVTVRFPDVENISFLDQAEVCSGEIKNFRDRLPRLKKFDILSVVDYEDL
ncbi:hypothetical protein N7447_004701 [Penicillium robsamsonii]|uniref:uncharacterized protein n=1 Tax=Penicillium robsamsonii TaxID=1792511 RepID=UPI002546B613|nr:uncharacterized protein N7447_004701 [Penicillium robsamsonii]KAJ5822361.1 hypothetical protein N7447_004701 [Penicillium robsamsonii]